MSKRNWSEDVLQSVQKKTGKSVSKGAVQRLAASVTPQTVGDERQLRQLIQSVGKLAGVRVSEETTRDLMQTIRKNKGNVGNLLSMLKQMKK